jgi:hypothetical protein
VVAQLTRARWVHPDRRVSLRYNAIQASDRSIKKLVA